MTILSKAKKGYNSIRFVPVIILLEFSDGKGYIEKTVTRVDQKL